MEDGVPIMSDPSVRPNRGAEGKRSVDLRSANNRRRHELHHAQVHADRIAQPVREENQHYLLLRRPKHAGSNHDHESDVWHLSGFAETLVGWREVDLLTPAISED